MKIIEVENLEAGYNRLRFSTSFPSDLTMENFGCLWPQWLGEEHSH
jgi:hypothetical protein